MLLPYFQEELLEAGCDEAGRGCLAGPVYAAAVILPRDFHHPLLNDSKQLTEEQRYELRPVIETVAIAFAVASLDNKKVDKYNIYRAAMRSMSAVPRCCLTPSFTVRRSGRKAPC